jgi:hypothetical protein
MEFAVATGIVPPVMLSTPLIIRVGFGLGINPVMMLSTLSPMPPIMLATGFPVGFGTVSLMILSIKLSIGAPLGTGTVPEAMLRTGFSRLAITLATGFPVGIGLVFVAVLSPMLSPTLAPTPTHNGKPMSAGNAEATKTMESPQMIVDCFILEGNGKKV